MSLLVCGNGKAPAAAKTPVLEHLLAAFGAVALSEPVGSEAARIARLERAFHESCSLEGPQFSHATRGSSRNRFAGSPMVRS